MLAPPQSGPNSGRDVDQTVAAAAPFAHEPRRPSAPQSPVRPTAGIATVLAAYREIEDTRPLYGPLVPVEDDAGGGSSVDGLADPAEENSGAGGFDEVALAADNFDHR